MDKQFTPEHITHLEKNEIFVFGSNLAGRHTGGAAKVALQHFGAIMGQGVGLQGNSYAIPTMFDEVDAIKPYVDQFIEFAKAHPDLHFFITKIGCGSAHFRKEDIAPLFTSAWILPNVSLPEEFHYIIEQHYLPECSPELVEMWRKAIQQELKDVAKEIWKATQKRPEWLGQGLGKCKPEEVLDMWSIAFHYLKFSTCPDLSDYYTFFIKSKSLDLGIRIASVGFKHPWCYDYGEYSVARELQKILEAHFRKDRVQQLWLKNNIIYSVDHKIREL